MRPAVLIPAAVVLILLAGVLVAAAAGMRMFTIVSPSMASTAPIGSLVITEPASNFRVGEIVTFTEHGEIYTHRISGITPGGYTTRGDLNAINDPWTLHRSDIIGAVVWHGAGWGWLLTALPWDLAGLIVILVVSQIARLPRSWRWAIRVTGFSLLFGITAAWLRPWLGVEMLDYTPASDGGVLMRVINTGLFNVDAHGTVLSSGQAAVIHLQHQSGAGRYLLTPTAALTKGQKAAATLVALLPLTIAVVAAWRPQYRHAATEIRRRAPRLTFVGLAVVLICVAIVGQTLTFASLTASVTNSSSAGSSVWANCRSTMISTSGLYVGYALGTSGRSETDLSGHGYTGTYSVAATASSGTMGCLLDTPQAAVNFNGTTQCLQSSSSSQETNPQVVSVEAWFRTTSTTPARIIGFSQLLGTADGLYDRMIYLDNSGRLVFGTYGAGFQYTSSPAGVDYRDGNWHLAVATLSSAGTTLYADGRLVASNSSITTGVVANGYWKVGCGTMALWNNANGSIMSPAASFYFTGQIQYAAAYTVVLTAAQVAAMYAAGTA